MDKKIEAQALLLKLNHLELTAIASLAAGESLRDLALRLSTDLAGAVAIRNSMKSKIGAKRDADAVRVALYAGMANLDA